ncbi:MAG: PucR family transcriptional regulator [Thermaerobacter sp.]|nr:PucR family transcriptional regulator [Thermaerobacter sp.]
MVTVRNVLERTVFAGAEVMAGQHGLDHPVRWVHVGEIPNISEFLKGGELVLSTGLGLTSADARHRYISGLMEARASGLLLELGSYLSEVPPDLLDVADRNRFPVIVFRHPVRFLDLSQDVNSLLISEHHRILDELESLSLRIRHALLKTEGIPALIRVLGETLNMPAAYRTRDDDGNPETYGSWPMLPGPFSDVCLHPSVDSHPVPYLRQTILVFGRAVGDLLLSLPTPILDERLYLACDRTAAAIAQDTIRAESLERTRHREDTTLLERLLFAEHPLPGQVKQFASRYRLDGTHSFRVLLLDTGPGPVTRAVRQGLSNIVTCTGIDQSDRCIIVAIGRDAVVNQVPAQAARWLQKSCGNSIIPTGVSASHHHVRELRDALLEADDAMLVARFQGGTTIGSYESLGIYRWILATSPEDLERLLIRPELGPLLDRSPHEVATSLQTLDALLDHPHSKLAAAQVLGIHRQTLYARMHTLAGILGNDFMAPERRIALEAATRAYRFRTAGQQRPTAAEDAIGSSADPCAAPWERHLPPS